MGPECGLSSEPLHFDPPSACGLGRQTLAIPCDVNDIRQPEHVVAQTMEHLGCIDILVNNAGGALPTPALNHMTRILVDESARHVRVNAIAPGSVETEALMLFIADESVRKKMGSLTPMGCIGTVEDVALAAPMPLEQAAVLGHLFTRVPEVLAA